MVAGIKEKGSALEKGHKMDRGTKIGIEGYIDFRSEILRFTGAYSSSCSRPGVRLW